MTEPDIPVYYETAIIGRIRVAEDGPSFSYDESWPRIRNAFPVSLRMPLEGRVVTPDVFVPWLMNILPEGGMLATISKRLGIAPEDVIGLIERIGRDTAGALSIGKLREGEHPGYRDVPDEAALERIIRDLPAKPFLVGEEGVSMSLAGAQEKLPVAMHKGRVAIPLNGAPSTHILKPDNEKLFGSVQNEAFCMVLARRSGLEVANVTTGVAGKRTYLLVERYDRLYRGERWHRIHQEDFCQALGKPPGAKYERNQTGIRGPSLKDMFEVARQSMSSRDMLRLLDAVIFNVAVTNVDSHAKNYSILLRGTTASLAPLYDLMCGEAYDNVTRNHAQFIGDDRNGRQIQGKHWRRMAEECQLNATAVLRRVRQLADKVEAEIAAAMDEVRAMPAGGHTMLKVFGGVVRARCKDLRLNLEEQKAPARRAKRTRPVRPASS